ncbi:MAG: hypothetical protein RI568_05425 [Natronomonas sp.]|uniref:hypothetical protein n=1 Tax=Natronomonas sp. TaxID=2184060 RepID=UPI0028706AF9|nr:hypothetical protein [Natronomonas sp.]MDR9430125.1 hypothetical protein [Natronomonas sp.]
MVVVSADAIRQYERFSLYNSPYPAHDAGCAIDLYPRDDVAISPVAGTVRAVRTVGCPAQPYAVSEDHLILVDCGTYVARMLHVEPAVEAGDRVEVGDRLGTLIRSGFFGRWVDNHIHLGFRRPEQNHYRASGSLRIEPDVSVTGLGWDGTGTVVETGKTHVQLDAPIHADLGFGALADDDGVPIDGGLAHYSSGGVLQRAAGERLLLGTPIGTADRRNVTWADVAVYANDRRATGLSLFAAQRPFGAKLVFRTGHEFSVDDGLTVRIEPTDDPIRLG